MNAQSTPLTRADVNRANAAHSTSPKSVAGRARSSRNAFKHGLYSKDLIILGEDPAEFDQLRATLRAEHQPANTTEEILVDELAQSFWRMRRFRHLEAGAWDTDTVNKWIDTGLMTLVQRAANSAERSFHKTLSTLAKLQKERGFVPQKTAQEQPAVIEEQSVAQEPGFVPTKCDATTQLEFENPAPKPECTASATRQAGFVPEKIASNAGTVPERTAAELELFKYFGYFPEDADKYVESLLEEAGYLPSDTKTAA